MTAKKSAIRMAREHLAGVRDIAIATSSSVPLHHAEAPAAAFLDSLTALTREVADSLPRGQGLTLASLRLLPHTTTEK